jgi:hypothetical protein
MTGRGQGYDVDALDVDAAISRHVRVQLTVHPEAGMAVPDRALDAAKGLHEKTNRHRRKLRVEITKQYP